MTITDPGIEIDCNDEQPEKVLAPSWANCERYSNLTTERHWQPLKQPGQIPLTNEGIQIESSDEQSENALAPRWFN
jgi:hypothetical protein